MNVTCPTNNVPKEKNVSHDTIYLFLCEILPLVIFAEILCSPQITGNKKRSPDYFNQKNHVQIMYNINKKKIPL